MLEIWKVGNTRKDTQVAFRKPTSIMRDTSSFFFVIMPYRFSVTTSIGWRLSEHECHEWWYDASE